MDMTDITNKFNNKISYNPKAKSYRYYVDGEPKSSVTTAIGKYTRPNLENWYKKNRDETYKELMLEEKKPLNEINDFLARVKQICDAKESFGRNIGTQLHEWIVLFLKGEEPVLPSDQPLKRTINEQVDFREFALTNPSVALPDKKVRMKLCEEDVETLQLSQKKILETYQAIKKVGEYWFRPHLYGLPKNRK